MGCDGIELDVRITQDGNPVVFHDRSLMRMTGQKGYIHRINRNSLDQMYLQPSQKERVPLLLDVLKLAGDRVILNLDVKKESMRNNGLEAAIVGLLQKCGLRDNIIISSFNPFVIKKFYQLNGGYRLGYIYHKRSHKFFSNGTPLDSMHVHFRRVSETYVARLHRLGFKVYAWTVDQPEEILQMQAAGVDGIISNYPERCLEVLDTVAPPAGEGI